MEGIKLSVDNRCVMSGRLGTTKFKIKNNEGRGEKKHARKIIAECQATAARPMSTATNCQYETATGSRLSLIVYKE